MTNKEYLQRAFELHRDLEKSKRRLEVLEHHARSCGVSYDKEVRNPYPTGSVLESMVVEIADLTTHINEQEALYCKTREEISQAISSVGDCTCEAILRDRYLLFLSWKDIALEMGYQMSYTYELHGRALQLVRIPEIYHERSSADLCGAETAT